MWDKLSPPSRSFRIYTELRLSHMMNLFGAPVVSSYVFCRFLWDAASLSDVHFEFVQPFSCCPEGDRGLLFPSLMLTWCWFGQKFSKQSGSHSPTGHPTSSCFIFVCTHPAPHLPPAVCVISCTRASSFCPVWCGFRWHLWSGSDNIVAVDQGITQI